MSTTRKSMIGLALLGAALAMPSAYAQTTPAAAGQTAPPADAMADKGTMQDDAMSVPSPSAAAAQPKQVTWADLDADKDGELSKAEVTTVPELSQVFDAADGDKNGRLSADEYKAFVAANAGGAKHTPGG